MYGYNISSKTFANISGLLVILLVVSLCMYYDHTLKTKPENNLAKYLIKERNMNDEAIDNHMLKLTKHYKN
jgi:hypothetical protein